MRLVALVASVVAVMTACGSGDESRSQVFAGILTDDPVGACAHHTFEATRDGALTLALTELRCGDTATPEISVSATLHGTGYVSGYMHAGESLSQANGSKGPYDVAVCLGRFRYAECQYRLVASQ